MKITNVIMIMVALMGLVGCENAEVKQHHLYNLEQCKAQAFGAEDAALAKGGDLGRAERDDLWLTHNKRAAQCMANTEHTTIEFQQAKGDDYQHR